MQPGDDQIILSLPPPTEYGRADFLASSSNEAARHWLSNTAEWPNGRLVVWGQPGCGKTHLAHLWAGASGFLTHNPSPGLLEGLPASHIAIDQADRFPNDADLLHLINTCTQAGHRLLMTACLPPARWAARLPDLVSRLRATTAVAIDPPDDALLTALLVRLLAARQLAVPTSVQNWLLRRLPRTAQALQDAVIRLDRASLARQRPITIALARVALADLWGSPPDIADGTAAPI